MPASLPPPPSISRRTALVGIGGATLAFCLGCSAQGAAPSGPVTIKVSDVPVGSGTIVGGFVVTQPQAGTFEAFNGACTHQGFLVQQVTTSAIVCGRHGSTFALTDGSVITGPAARPLAKATVTRNGDQLTIS
ncbi:MAG: Rieske (2Fe-2S) protein [Propionibacteriales bacterium]|nr:Rieske (2Fe-2S) protein [Propionibacteriales bacterium]